MVRLGLLCFLLSAAGIRAGEPGLAVEDEAFFEAKVRPILVSRCFECHGAEKQQGDVRLDSPDALQKNREGGPVVVAGKPDESRLIEVIGYGDAIKMPPKAQLAAEEIAALTDWVRRGAPFPAGQAPALISPTSGEGILQAKAGHWAYQPVRRPAPPDVREAGWPATAIDGFILSRLEAAGIAPSPEANRPTLIRRLTFDLTGLPPTFEEVEAFCRDDHPDAWERLVDRLLASPRYGERWGRHWLDVARYADTKGYVFTEERKYPFSYTYRDFVIQAFNDDKPFDRFVVEQLAADQLPLGDDKRPLAAMGFLTLGRRFGNNIHDIIDDRIDVVGRGLLGLAVGCARCHDHKFDPIPTEDYYALYGVFSASIEPGDLPLIGEASDSEGYRQFEVELQKREQAVREYTDAEFLKLQDDLRAKTPEYLSAAVSKEQSDGLSRFFGRGDLRRGVVERWRAFLNDSARQHSPVFESWHRFARLPVDRFAEQSPQVLAELAAPPAGATRINARIREALLKSPPKSMAEVVAAYGTSLVAAHGEWQKLRKMAPAAQALPDAEAEELRLVLYSEKSPLAVSKEDAQRLYDRAVRNKIRELQRAVDSHKANSPAAPPRAMVLNDIPNPPATSQVFLRGNPGRPGPQVPRRFLQVLSRPGDGFRRGSGRLELANAIAHPDNPLTARVIVNRVWMHHFGQGLVRTPSDFGVRGEKPSHPELLDELARTFMDDGWSLKRLHKRIVLSRTWRQSSQLRAEAAMKDPENRLLWRMSPRRLEFEPIRDTLLAVSGNLDATTGGRPVDLLSQPFSRRRTVYGFIDRQDLPGLFRSFDFASPDVSTPQRPQTTIPQQILFAMNSPFAIEQVRGLASRPEVAGKPSRAEQVQSLYRLIFARDPDPAETETGVAFLSSRETSAPETGASLTLLAQYAQALLLSNEFVFLD